MADEDPSKLHHRGDPDTSLAAAHFVVGSGLAEKHRRRIMGALDVGGVMSAEQIADAGGLTLLQVMKRVTELMRDGLVERTAIKRRNRSGREAYCYRVVPPRRQLSLAI